MNKKIIVLFLSIILSAVVSITTFASGDGNINNGGGGMGDGTSQNSWTPGDEGVRVTIVDADSDKVVGKSIDYSNINPGSGIINFGKVSKIQYRDGVSLSLVRGNYSCMKPAIPMPRIISSSGVIASLAEIKRYFCSDGAARMIASDSGISFEKLTDGEYKLLIEPIAYFTYQGIDIGMTAHEAAMYDQIQDGNLRSYMGSLTHQNLPFAMFLEKGDLGFPAWTGASTGKQSDNTIINSLGMGIVSYKASAPEPADLTNQYRTNTDVITSVTLNTSNEITPSNPATVTFNVCGVIHTMSNIVIPEGESQLVWCKWRTPAYPQSISISISASKGYLSSDNITANVVSMDEKIPPNPKATDINDSFVRSSIPSYSERKSASWGVWSAYWKADWRWVSVWNWQAKWEWESNWQWDSDWKYDTKTKKWIDYGNWVDSGKWVDNGQWVDNGYWKDFGKWVYDWTGYTATLSVSNSIFPDSKVPTGSRSVMKSGYGINLDVSTSLNSNAPGTHITGIQNVVTYFPEFNYKSYWRLLDMVTGGYSAQFKFKVNRYSTYNQRVHFTPVWYPNGTYTTYTRALDAWTPAGMLSGNLTESIQISGSVFDDWHISPKN